MVHPIMNLDTELVGVPSNNYAEEKRADNLVHVLGNSVLLSDGRLEKGYEPDLITKRGKFNISSDDSDRFYWGEGDHFFASVPYMLEDGEVYLGYRLVGGYTSGTFLPTVQIYNPPLLNVEALYKNNKRSVLGHGMKRKKRIPLLDNTEGKIGFLEEFLAKEDKSGYQPKDMEVSNPKARLKLLETHYRNNVKDYNREEEIL